MAHYITVGSDWSPINFLPLAQKSKLKCILLEIIQSQLMEIDKNHN